MLICVTRARAFPPFWWTRRAFSLPSQLVPSHGASSVITLRSVPSAKLPRRHPRRQSKSACLLTDLLTRHQPPGRTDLLSRHQPRHMRRACVATPLGGGLVRAPVWGLARVRVRVRVKVRARARVRVLGWSTLVVGIWARLKANPVTCGGLALQPRLAEGWLGLHR